MVPASDGVMAVPGGTATGAGAVPPPPGMAVPGGTALSRGLWIASLAVLATGHIALTFVDGMARNAWTLPACTSILAGYIMMAASIGCRED